MSDNQNDKIDNSLKSESKTNMEIKNLYLLILFFYLH